MSPISALDICSPVKEFRGEVPQPSRTEPLVLHVCHYVPDFAAGYISITGGTSPRRRVETVSEWSV
jgi:hypothetical protein